MSDENRHEDGRDGEDDEVDTRGDDEVEAARLIDLLGDGSEPVEVDQNAQEQARTERHEALEREADRKRDTRRKVIAGGALFALARADDPAACEVLARVLVGLDERSRRPFKGWDWKRS